MESDFSHNLNDFSTTESLPRHFRFHYSSAAQLTTTYRLIVVIWIGHLSNRTKLSRLIYHYSTFLLVLEQRNCNSLKPSIWILFCSSSNYSIKFSLVPKVALLGRYLFGKANTEWVGQCPLSKLFDHFLMVAASQTILKLEVAVEQVLTGAPTNDEHLLDFVFCFSFPSLRYFHRTSSFTSGITLHQTW